MSNHNPSPAILFRENTLMPEGSAVESEIFFKGWRIIKNLDRSAFTRRIEGANWYFFYLAGAIKASVVGRDRAGTLRRAVKRVLARRDGQRYNAIEITKILSKRFLGIPIMRITAHFRHIQQGVALVPAEDVVLRMPVASPSGEAAAGQQVALISST